MRTQICIWPKKALPRPNVVLHAQGVAGVKTGGTSPIMEVPVLFILPFVALTFAVPLLLITQLVREQR